jgi:hypothetical protein
VASISEIIGAQVRSAAGEKCEYCRTSSRVTGIPLVIDHVIPISAGGGNERENLAAACYRCNEFKGAKTHGNDPVTGEIVPLFNPYRQRWSEHFIWGNGERIPKHERLSECGEESTHIVGVTPTGRATVIALRLNNEYVVEARMLWISYDWHPPRD